MALCALSLTAVPARSDEILLRTSESRPDAHPDATVVLVGLANETALQGLQLRLDYDPAVARPVSITGVGRLGDPRRLHYWVEPGAIRALVCDLSAARASIEPGDGPLVSVAFERSGGATGDTLRVRAEDLLAVTESLNSRALPAARIAIPMERTAARTGSPPARGASAALSAGSDPQSGDPTEFVLGLAGPMPASRGTTLFLDVPRAGPVRVAVYDVRGRLVRMLNDRVLAVGRHTIHWDGLAADGTRAGAGLFFVRVAAEGVLINRKIIALQ